ncbi:hypothetical protein QYE76_068892 [Lolium multiflorum]|uniref:Transposase (putative) gypsy type domain-containing protein n=1 Tax=Lolium multiflorum TaxID=4521 RepID=A0AAD8SH62_LOLMU|nr:hypothetical protein QYE76_068892 [Lolium multiflorum]
MLKKMGFSKKENALQFPKEESYPKPPINYRVSFVDHLIRGLSPPIHEFLRGLLFVYGLQLHHLTPNSLLHISIFITLCECFLGVQPNWALWKRIFCIRRNSHHNVAYNIGGVVICVRSEVDYFDVKFPDSVQGWRKKWLYIHEESSNPAEENIAPFDGEAKIFFRRRSWDAEATEAEKLATEALMTRIHELQNTRGKELSGIEITAYFLRTRVQPLQARKNPFWKYAGEEDADRLSKDLPLKDFEKLIRKISSLNKKDLVPTSCRVAPYSSAKPLPEGHLFLLLFLLFLKVEKWRSVPLSMTTKAPLALPLKSRPLMKEFIRLGTQFVGYRDYTKKLEDLGLKLRQEGLKIGVEGTIALIADSQQDVDWAKVGDIGEMETKKWQSLIRAAKPSARPILSFLGVKPAPAPSASKPEVK